MKRLKRIFAIVILSVLELSNNAMCMQELNRGFTGINFFIRGNETVFKQWLNQDFRPNLNINNPNRAQRVEIHDQQNEVNNRNDNFYCHASLTIDHTTDDFLNHFNFFNNILYPQNNVENVIINENARGNADTEPVADVQENNAPMNNNINDVVRENIDGNANDINSNDNSASNDGNAHNSRRNKIHLYC